MPVGLLGRKIGMTQVYDDQGNLQPVTVIQAGPCTVLQVRTPDRDGYEAVQLGFEDKPRRLATRSERGHVAAIGSKRAKRRAAGGIAAAAKPDCEPQRYVREFRTDGENSELQVGNKLTVQLFSEVSHVDVIGTTKGRGFAGVMKRHNFHGLRASHGVQRHHRAPGGIGGHATNRGFCGRIKKGKRMAGRYGGTQATIRNLKVVKLDEANNCMLVLGAIPGPNGGFVMIRQTNKLG
ncbi:MAG TPA: 50S ribosomal protein L3 [Planctomycetaceae bacterium]|nr:50S ribosomal protein L3 [Planctomycetaceae bacterium]